LVKTTLLDYPGQVAAVVFVPGCNLRCPWCQNPGLIQSPWADDLVPRAGLLAFLAKRRNVLGGVVVTGGEPLFHPETVALLAEIRSLGYQLKLDTNGTFPRRLAQLEPSLVDYVAMDLKNAPSRYANSTGLSVATKLLTDSLALLAERWPGRSEVRLTWVPGLNRVQDLPEYAVTAGGLAAANIPVWVQAYRPGLVLDPVLATTRAPTDAELANVVTTLVSLGVDARRR
jgi:pyruvate formate lyase activating enzyme